MAVDGGSKGKTEWVNIECWEKTAENCQQYLKKGSKAYIEGRLKTDTWEGNDGQKKYKTVIVAGRVLFLDKRDSGEGQDRPQAQPNDYEDVPINEDDFPF
jgi:single-strand DNA-binding protein